MSFYICYSCAEETVLIALVWIEFTWLTSESVCYTKTQKNIGKDIA
jgi:hypothetical protein